MSRFLRSTSDTESDSESSSDNESQYSEDDFSSDEESYHSDDQQADADDQPKKSRFLKGGSDSDSDDESTQKRQARSQKDKRLDEMEAAVRAIENGQKNNDWNLISTGKKIKKTPTPKVHD
jgi:translation initiation factor 3 subunit C